MKFSEFNFNQEINEAVSYMGFKEATPVQEKAIPEILNNKDLIACAQTGTGKTAAFILPVLHKLSERKSKHTAALILVPTRELAMQIDNQLQGFAYFAPVSSIPIYGGGDGSNWSQQKKALTQGADIIIATPGKLISHLNMGYVKFNKLDYLILDEADRMLDIGFFDDIMKIAGHLPKERQTMMFSATMPSKIKELAKRILKNPAEISLEMSKPAEGVLQAAYLTYDKQKNDLIHSLLKDKPEHKSILIFTSTKKKVNEIVKSLRSKKYNCQGISSDLEQDEREKVLLAFRNKKIRILVATDVLSRGIDIKDINLVFNYDVPSDAEDYVHRVGRTARAETTGVAITFINPTDMQRFAKIEKLIERRIHKLPVPEELGKSPEWKLSGKKRKPSKKRKARNSGSKQKKQNPRNKNARKGNYNKKQKK